MIGSDAIGKIAIKFSKKMGVVWEEVPMAHMYIKRFGVHQTL